MILTIPKLILKAFFLLSLLYNASADLSENQANNSNKTPLPEVKSSVKGSVLSYIFGVGVTEKYPNNRILQETMDQYLKNENYDIILNDLSKLETHNENFLDHQIILKYKAIAHFKSDEFTSAEVELDDFIRSYPDDLSIQEMQYMLAESQFNQRGDWLYILTMGDSYYRDTDFLVNAFRSYKSYLRQYPVDKHRAHILERMAVIKNILSKKVLMQAEFNFKNKAYIGALERCSEILKFYPGTVSEIEALNLMAKSYSALGLNSESEEVQEIIHLNKSRFS